MAVLRDVKGAIEHIKGHVSIVDVMSKDMQLDRASDDLYKGLCCFHEEKTPSLTVTPSKGLYHCFGCKASGDVVTFMQRYHNMGTSEAVRHLSESYHVSISAFERELTPEERERMALETINRDTRDYLHAILMTKGNRGYHYLSVDRGISDDMMVQFGLGYSANIADSTAKSGRTDRYADALELDRDAMWTDAVIYPLHDPYGRVVGFKNRPYWGGRTTDDRGHKYPKFMGTSSKSPLHMDDHVYGLHIARKHIDRGRLIGVEGQHDVIKLHQYNIRNVVGTDGTAFNDAKVKLLEEFGVREFVVLFDGDAAGKEASIKVATESAQLSTSISIKIARLPDGFDPDEYIDAYGPIAIMDIVGKAVYASQYLIDRLADDIGLDNVTQRIDFIRRSQPVILNASPVEQSFLMQYVAEMAKTSQTVIEDMIREEQSRGAKALLYNINGEKIVIGTMMRDEDFRISALTEMTRSDWFLPKHEELFGMIAKMVDNSVPVNIDTLRIAMNNNGLGQLLSNGEYIDELYSMVGDYIAAKDDIIDKSIRRRLMKMGDELKSGAQDLKARLVLVAEEHISKVQSSLNSAVGDGLVTPKDGAMSFMADLHKKMSAPDKILGIPLGDNWKSLNSILDGLQRKLLITVGANQSVGKTTLVANWLNDIAITQKRKWIHFSLEMPSEQMVSKIIGIRAGVDAVRVRRGNLTNEEYRKVQMASAEYYSGGLTINDKATTLERIIAECRKLVRTDGIEGVSIDYVQLMHMERNRYMKKYEEEGDISGALKNDLAKALNLPVVILSQLSRGAKDKVTPTAEDGAGAYKIAQDSDIYMVLFEKKPEEIERWGIEKGNMSLNVDKNRLGAADMVLDLFFQKELQRMMEVV